MLHECQHDVHGKENHTEFDELNDDCKLLIMEQLDFYSLSSIAGTNKHFLFLARDIFRRNFALKKIKMFLALEPIQTREYNDSIELIGLESSRYFVNQFGPVTMNLRLVDGSVKGEMAREIVTLLNRNVGALNSLQLNILDMDRTFEEKLQKLLQLNPKIRSLSFSTVSESVLKCASEHLPNLETLNLELVKWNEHKLHFKSIKNLMSMDNDHFADIATFDNLESLTLTDGGDAQWIQFMRRHPTLKYLTILNIFVTDSVLKEIMQSVPNLVEASMKLSTEVEADTVIQFLNRCTKLKRFESLFFGQYFNPGRTFNEIEERIRNEWNVTTYNGYKFILEK